MVAMLMPVSSSGNSEMNDYSVELSYAAQLQLKKIRDYIRDQLESPEAANKFLDDTEEAIESLRQLPYAHMIRPNSKLYFGNEKRQFFYRDNYCLFYIIIEEKKIVRIIKITYSRSDLSNE